MRTPPRKNAFSYLLPFFLLGLVITFLVYWITSSGAFTFGAGAPAFLQVKNPEVKVLLKNNDTWRTVPENVNIKLFRGDSVKTTQQGEGKLTLLKNSFMYLGNDTNVDIKDLSESDSFQNSDIAFLTGKALVSVERILNPKSNFYITSNTLRISSRGGVFILSNDLVQVLEGKITVEKLEKGKAFADTELGVGQQLDLSEPENGAFHELSAIKTEVYASPWVERALGKKIEDETKKDILVQKDITTNNADGTTPEGITTETTKKDSEETKNHTLSIKNLEGLNANASIEIDTNIYEISGTVSNGAEKIFVNDYQLSKFQKDGKEWLYRVNTALGNLKEGINIYTVKAIFDDESSVEKTITIIFTKKTTASGSLTESSDTAVSLQLAVVSPKEDERVNLDPVTIRGTAPTGTVKIVVNDYTLRTFQAGDTQWKYSASQAFENLIPGEINKFLITAYDKDNKAIASINFQFFSTAEKVAAATATTDTTTSSPTEQ